jgi:hypothetical protein
LRHAHKWRIQLDWHADISEVYFEGDILELSVRQRRDPEQKGSIRPCSAMIDFSLLLSLSETAALVVSEGDKMTFAIG